MKIIKALQTKLSIIFLGLLFGQVSFGGVVVFFLKPEEIPNHPNTTVFLIVSTALLLSGIVAGILIANARLVALREQPIENAATGYTSITIIRFALIESPVLFSIIAFLLTGNKLFLIFVGVGIAYFIYLFPSKGKIEKELGWNGDPMNGL